MRLSPTRFNGFLNTSVKQSFGWRKASACPCTAAFSGGARPDCPLCNGKGRIWAAEVAGLAAMTNQTPKKAFAAFGTWEPGDATFTIPSDSPLYAIGQYDRIRALNSTNPFSEVLTRGLHDKIVGSIVSIDRIFWLNDAGDTIIEGGIPSVGADGTLTWASGEPPMGRQYSISGVRYDEFFVFQPLSSDRNSGIDGLPMKLAARVFDLFAR